jgi:PIN domain nuclease of toxin-antitoxin system
MRLLLDTHIAVWAALDPAALTQAERYLMTDTRDPLPHKDPFDELLLMQAQEEGLRLLTREARLVAHPLAISG